MLILDEALWINNIHVFMNCPELFAISINFFQFIFTMCPSHGNSEFVCIRWIYFDDLNTGKVLSCLKLCCSQWLLIIPEIILVIWCLLIHIIALLLENIHQHEFLFKYVNIYCTHWSFPWWEVYPNSWWCTAEPVYQVVCATSLLHLRPSKWSMSHESLFNDRD